VADRFVNANTIRNKPVESLQAGYSILSVEGPVRCVHPGEGLRFDASSGARAYAIGIRFLRADSVLHLVAKILHCSSHARVDAQGVSVIDAFEHITRKRKAFDLWSGEESTGHPLVGFQNLKAAVVAVGIAFAVSCFLPPTDIGAEKYTLGPLNHKVSQVITIHHREILKGCGKINVEERKGGKQVPEKIELGVLAYQPVAVSGYDS